MNKKKIVKGITIGVITVGMALSFVTGVFAASDADYSKNENVYVALDYEGKMINSYVVNTFTVTKEGEITDYGDYAAVKNLTNLDAIKNDEDEHSFNAENGKYFYQGELNNAQLPWKFEISYTLDGKSVKQDELTGADGNLKMHIKEQKNPAQINDVFYNNYRLQIGINLDTEKCKNIEANGAILSDAGSDENLTFVVMPGTDADYEVTTEVKNFEMDDVTINAVPTTDVPVSYVSSQNTHMGKVSFALSADGVKIPKETKVAEAVTTKPGIVEKLLNLIRKN
ncbi:hypothetical protein GH810_04125 [Acetobacterium paludosum]|uniref:Uncharacterized protein n=1 Tax=Acetobacterium paludosum TaxID=52693 RepID=A0A923I1R5_9FIRM|nr:hypothetical protein [Acetobacterium paludosum]MBC3887490.1 hypothetical protein [Acetobacterium paludosum]